MPLDLLSRIAILAPILAASSIVLAAVLLVPPEPGSEDPFRGVVFFSERDTYALGDEAILVLQNHGELAFNFDGWNVARLIGETWVVVECHFSSTIVMTLRPGGQMIITWSVGPAHPLCGTLPPVEPGLYRGTVGLTPLQESAEQGTFFAEFIVT